MLKISKLLLTLLTLGIFSPTIINAETFVRSDVHGRVILAFNVNEQAAQALLPEGWKPLTIPKGPIAGTNLLVVLKDEHIALGPDGKEFDPNTGGLMMVANYAAKAGVKGSRMFISRVFETPPVAAVYGNTVPAAISRDYSLKGEINRPRIHHELWKVKPETGGEANFRLSFKTRNPQWSVDEKRVYSAAKEDFYHIARFQQLSYLVMSKPIGLKLDGEVTFNSSIPELSAVFDGNQRLIAVLARPMSQRQISLP